MIQVDIFRSKKLGYDIIVINTGRYLSGTVFDFITQYLNTHVDECVKRWWFWDDTEEYIQSCLAYRGIAIKLFGHLEDWTAAKKAVRATVMDALDEIDS